MSDRQKHERSVTVYRNFWQVGLALQPHRPAWPMCERVYRTAAGDSYSVGVNVWQMRDGTIVEADVPLIQMNDLSGICLPGEDNEERAFDVGVPAAMEASDPPVGIWHRCKQRCLRLKVTENFAKVIEFLFETWA